MSYCQDSTPTIFVVRFMVFKFESSEIVLDERVSACFPAAFVIQDVQTSCL